MDYLQYLTKEVIWGKGFGSFKPYYKWITFNTCKVINDMYQEICKF